MASNNIQIIFIIRLIIFIAAICVAWSCNKPNERLGPVLVGLFIPEIYIIQYVIRRYALGVKYECN